MDYQRNSVEQNVSWPEQRVHLPTWILDSPKVPSGVLLTKIIKTEKQKKYTIILKRQTKK